MKVHKKSEAFTSFDIGQSKEADDNINAIEEVTSTKYVVRDIPIEDIEFNPKNTRFNDEDTDEEIAELAENIKLYGLFHPIGVFPRGDKYMLFSGERRTKAYIKLRKRYIPAMIFPDMGDFGNMERLYQANLQSRMLDAKKRFFAFKDLLSGYETKISAGKTEELAKKLSITKATVKKYKELYQNADEGDFELLESGEITWNEFVQHTRDVIAEREKAQYQRRIEFIRNQSDTIEATNYMDSANNTVYSVERDENGKFCMAVTDANLYKVPLHYQNQVFVTFEDAQVALNLFAITNNLTIYKGDFSEFKKQNDPSTVLSESKEAQSDDSDNTPADTDSIDDEDFAPSLFETVPTQPVTGTDNITDNSISDTDIDDSPRDSEKSNEEDDGERHNSDTDNQAAEKESPKTQSPAASSIVKEDKDESDNKPENNDSDYLKQYATFSGYSVEDKKRYEGALVYSGTRAFIIFRLAIDSGVKAGNATKKTTAYYVEVEPKSVIKYELQ